MPSTSRALDNISRPNRIDRVTPKVRKAIQLMVWEGMQIVEAAKQVGLTGQAMRLAIEKPAVLAALKREKQVLRESVSARNIHRLREIRDAADNMPAIQAIRTLEQLGEETHTASGLTPSQGITIRIVNEAPSPQMVDVTPGRSNTQLDGQ
jgi:hypothetical protein